MAEYEAIPVRQTPNTPRGQSAFGRGDGIIHNIAHAGPKLDRRRADEQPAGASQRSAAGETPDKTLRHLDYRRAGGLPPTGRTYITPIAQPMPGTGHPGREDRR